jgi:branched-chain amino acid transport system permease protein
MTQFLQLAFDGFALGCVYALIALGFAVVYRASQVINFAQGAMLLVGAYLVSLFAA